MIDLETLSLDPNATVISMGAAIFNDEQVVESGGWAIDPRWWHGHIEPTTLAWWAHPDRDASREFSFAGNMTDFDVAFHLKTFLAQHNVDEIWANDPEFDLVVLKQWWKRVGHFQVPGRATQTGGDYPINYKKSRSFRTIMAEAERLGHDMNDARGMYVAHNPIDDAVSQARAVIAARKAIGVGSLNDYPR
jgi:hypothetical protein